MVARGEIWWFEPPDDKPRPVLVLTRDEAIPLLTRIVAVPTTTTTRGVSSEVPLGRDDGMPADCVLSFDNLGLFNKMYLTRRMTTLPSHRSIEVCEALTFTLAC